MLDRPTNELLDEYISKFDKNERYETADRAITNLFAAFPENKNLRTFYLKSASLMIYIAQTFLTFLRWQNTSEN